MAQTFVTSIQMVTSDLRNAFLVDNSVYGGANPQRSELAIYALLFKRNAEDTDTPVALDNSDPVNVVQWVFDLASNDGQYIALLWAFEIWAAGTYNQDVGVYYAGDGNFYKSLTTTNDVPGTSSEWDLIVDFQVDVPASVENGQTYNWSSAHTEAGPIGDALQDLSPKIRQGKCQNWNDASAVMTGVAALNGAYFNFRRGDYTEAQKDIDYLQAQTAATL